MKHSKLSLDRLLQKLEKNRAAVCNKILQDYSPTIYEIAGSIHKHQAWKGGYLQHVSEVMNIAVILYESLNAKRSLEFSLSDALFILFLHDFDKVLRYQSRIDVSNTNYSYNSGYHAIIQKLLAKNYHYHLNEVESNALKYVHGEGEDYHPSKRVMLPLGCFVHCCDMISARIWFDEGKNENFW